MHPIIDKAALSPNVTRLVVSAPRIALVRRPGQFVIVRLGDGAERIPLTIADADPDAGTITLVIQAVGKSTMDLAALEVGEAIRDVAGPLGKETELIDHGRALCVGGGVGTAVVHPIAQGLHARGVAVTSIIGGRSREWVIFEEELRRYGDGRGVHRRRLLRPPRLRDRRAQGPARGGGVDHVYAVGPVPMMRAVSALTYRYEVPTVVSLNAIMVDGTGMCGGCRVTVGGQTQFACVDGPEFDAHQVDFAQLADRLTTYRPFEQGALERRACKVDALAESGRRRPPDE